MNKKTPPFFLVILLSLVLGTVGCEKNPTDDDHTHGFHVSFLTAPATVVTNTSIEFTFEVEDDGVHVEGLTSTMAEFEMTGMTPVEMTLTEDSIEHGHYVGTITFTAAGSYEVHFHYIHDGVEDHATVEGGLTVQ